jgi:hypothetical protein
MLKQKAVPNKRLVTLVAAMSLGTICLIVPQRSLAQLPNVSGNWNGNVTITSELDTVTSSLSSSSTAVSASVQTNNTQLPSTSGSGGVNSQTQNCGSSCPLLTTVQMLFSGGISVTVQGTVDGNNLANGTFTATDSTGRTITGSASGSLSNGSVSLSFSGTRNDGVVENGGVDASNGSVNPPPPDPCGGSVCLILC